MGKCLEGEHEEDESVAGMVGKEVASAQEAASKPGQRPEAAAQPPQLDGPPVPFFPLCLHLVKGPKLILGLLPNMQQSARGPAHIPSCHLLNVTAALYSKASSRRCMYETDMYWASDDCIMRELKATEARSKRTAHWVCDGWENQTISCPETRTMCWPRRCSTGE